MNVVVVVLKQYISAVVASGRSKSVDCVTVRPNDCSRSTHISYILYLSDGLGGRAFDHHSRNGERGICKRILPAGPGICPIFSNARGLPGGMLAVGIDSHIIITFTEY